MVRCWERERILPAREKWPVFVDCGCAGRVLYRLSLVAGVAGRVLYRLGWWMGGGVPVMGIEWCSCGRKISLLGGAALETRKSSPCSGKMARFWCFWACWASFFAVWPGLGCCWASFFARERLEGRAGRVFSRFGQDWAVAGQTFLRGRSSPVEWCNRFVSFGVGYALSWSVGSSCWVGCGVSRDLVRMSRLR